MFLVHLKHSQSFNFFSTTMKNFIIGVQLFYKCCVNNSFCCTTNLISCVCVCVCVCIHFLLNLPPPSHPTPLGQHRPPSWACCVIQQPPTSYLFYAWQGIYVNATLLIHSTPLPSHIHICSLCLHLPFCPAYMFTCTICLDSIDIH